MQAIIFHLDREHVALNDLLKLTGLAGSGGEGKALVARGAVVGDGIVETRKTAKIRGGQRVRVGEVEILVHDDGSAPHHVPRA
jgi:ribosome-associated protein